MKKTNGHRPIDDITKISYRLLSKWNFLRKIKSRNLKIAIIAAFVLGLMVAVSLLVSLKIQMRSVAVGETAKISIVPSSTSVNVGDNFTADAVLNTNGSSSVAVTAIIKYNPSQLQLVNYDTSSSIFAYNNTCIYNNAPCQIIENDTASGTISVTLAKPNPGVNTANGKLVSLSFKALTAAAGSNISVNFISVGDYNDSNVILNDNISTDILSSVTNAIVTILAPVATCTSFTYSAWGTCTNSTQTRTVVSSLPSGCTGGNPILSQSCVASCTKLTLKSGSATPTSVAENGTYNITCDYGAQKDAVNAMSDLGKCAWISWSGTVANFQCNAGSAGTRTNKCWLSNATTENICAQEDSINNVTVTGSSTATCTSFTYSAWSTCNKKTKIQTRTVISSQPAGCTGGSPILRQTCRR